MPTAVDINGTYSTQWPVSAYSRPPMTDTNLDWAPLVEIDISGFDEPGEKQRLAAQLEDAVKNVGFWIVKGHGISDEEVLRQLAIADAFFKLPKDEKLKVQIDLAHDHNYGYRNPIRKLGDTGFTESVETYEIHKDIPSMQYPLNPFLEAHFHEIAPFQLRVFERVAVPLFKLIAIILELPEDYFVQRDAYDTRSEDWMRWMLNQPRPREFYKATAGLGVGGHTDHSAITLLFEQNVACLQMLTSDGLWKTVKPVKGGITVNAGELLKHMTKDFVKATIHRVAPPQDDQLQYERLGLIYFVCFNDDVELRPAPSPKLQRLGMLKAVDTDPATQFPTAREYVTTRMRQKHHRTTFEKRSQGTTFEFKGLKTPKHYD